MPLRKRKTKEGYGVGKQKRLKQLQLARELKRSVDESTTSTATMSAPDAETKEHGDGDVQQIQRSSDKEVFIDMFFICSDTYLHEIN